MKTGQLLEYNLWNIFLEKSLDQYSKVLYILFLLFAKLKTIESDWN